MWFEICFKWFDLNTDTLLKSFFSDILAKKTIVTASLRCVDAWLSNLSAAPILLWMCLGDYWWLSPPTDYQMTVSSVKALFLYTPSPPAKEASVHDPQVKHSVCFFVGLW